MIALSIEISAVDERLWQRIKGWTSTWLGKASPRGWHLKTWRLRGSSQGEKAFLRWLVIIQNWSWDDFSTPSFLLSPSFHPCPVQAVIQPRGKTSLCKRSAAPLSRLGQALCKELLPFSPYTRRTCARILKEKWGTPIQTAVWCCQFPQVTLGGCQAYCLNPCSSHATSRGTSLKCASKGWTRAFGQIL